MSAKHSTRPVVVQTRLSLAEFKSVSEAARAAGLTLSAYLRAALRAVGA